MRIFSYVLLLTVSIQIGYAQRSKIEDERLKAITDKSFWLTTGTGFNNHFGLIGISLEDKLSQQWTIFGGTGIGTWGTKSGIGMRTYKQYPLRRAFSFSLTRASGITDLSLNANAINPNGAVIDTTVTFNLDPVYQFNVSWMRFWRVSDWCRFYIEAGYSFLLSGRHSRNFELITPGYQLSELTRRIMTAIQPGGLTVAFGFSFALN
jgi:hypothetical protein